MNESILAFVPTACSSSLLEAAQLMRRRHVGALVVTEDEPGARRAVGIVTDRDLVLRAMANGIGPRDAVVGDVMTQVLATINDGADVFEALEVMHGKGVRRLAVADAGGTLLGVISLDDVLAALGAELSSVSDVLATEMQSEHEHWQREPIMMAVG